jgi:hypothetical protein
VAFWRPKGVELTAFRAMALARERPYSRQNASGEEVLKFLTSLRMVGGVDRQFGWHLLVPRVDPKRNSLPRIGADKYIRSTAFKSDRNARIKYLVSLFWRE